MKTIKLMTVGTLALASLALMSSPALAANTVPTPASGDLVLGLDDFTQGTTQDYEVDLGNISTYETPGYTATDITAFSATAIAGNANFGAGWAGNSDLEFAIAGTNGSTVFVTTTEGAPTGFTSEITAGVGAISQYVGEISGLAATAAAPNNTGTLAITASTANSISYELTNTFVLANPFNMPALASNDPAEQVTDTTGVDENSSEVLYALTSTGSTKIGTFTLDGSDGDLSFQSAIAAPEPSSYALAIFGGLVLWVMRRRRVINS